MVDENENENENEKLTALIEKTDPAIQPSLISWIHQTKPSKTAVKQMVKDFKKIAALIPPDHPHYDLTEIARRVLWDRLTYQQIHTLYYTYTKIQRQDFTGIFNGDPHLNFDPYDQNDLAELAALVHQENVAAIKPLPYHASDIQSGDKIHLYNHVLYCGDTSDSTFIELARKGNGKGKKSTFAFADPPYNANIAVWDRGFEWNHDYLAQTSEVVAVTPGIESIPQFLARTQMPYIWAMAAHITNGMTRGKLGFGNWIFIALFSQLSSIHRNAQDVLKLSISTADTQISSHPGRKPPQLMRQLIDLFTLQNQTIIDPFAGSGTTLFAANDLNRTCITGEINPEYCAQIVNRFQDETGLAAHFAN